ncbi:putative Alpha/Beta hydrolase protein [Seiridium cardinale]|uniref:Alpha/Beta hydrolase protein n=1 Tax=Seiridium cardinale TaxID=138064 RepID=A0ABR2XSL4_9PEZI
MAELKTATTPVLSIKYYEHGSPTGWPVVLSHGFPYSPVAFDDVIPHLVSGGARVIVPYLRGYGPTRFLSPETMRSGQQAALGSDVVALLDALGIDKAVLAGFDWGGVVSCVGAALWPERVAGLVSYAGYDVVDLARQADPFGPGLESVMWYQHLFQSERGRKCLAENRRELCRLLWTQWSPGWAFSDDVWQRTASAFDNPDFVDVVIHAYRFIQGQAPGDPGLEGLEQRLAKKPKITVPCITLDGSQDPLKPGGSVSHAEMFAGRHERREMNVGHAFPAEAPKEFAEAILDVHSWST